MLADLRDDVVKTNREYAKNLGIEQSVSTTV